MKFARISLVLSLPLLIAAATAPAAPTKLAAERAAELMKDLKNFTLMLNYVGDSDKPFYGLTVSVKAAPAGVENTGFELYSQITEDDARKIIDYLATEGFLDNAVKDKYPKTNFEGSTGYLLGVNRKYVENTGFDLKMLGRLDNLDAVLPDAPQKKMKILLGRLSGYRKQWQQAIP